MSESYIVHVREENDKQTLYSWGWNEHSNLGLGDKLDRDVPTKIPGLDEIAIKDVFAGGAYFFVKF